MTVTITDEQYQELMRIKREYEQIICNAKDEANLLVAYLEEDRSDLESFNKIKLLNRIFGKEKLEELIK